MSANKFYKSSKPTKRTKHTATAPGIPELFVGGLPSHVTGADLHVFFGCYGRVADVRMMNYRDGMSRGFAFVRFQAIESAQKVILMSPLSYAGKAIECKLALSKEQSKIFIELNTMKKIYIGNLNPDTTDQDLKIYFEKFGKITNARTITTVEHYTSRGFGFVGFEKEESAMAVLTFKSSHIINGSAVKCRPAVSKSETENLKYDVPVECSNLHPKEDDPVDYRPQVQEDSNVVYNCRKRLGHPQGERHSIKLHAIKAKMHEMCDSNLHTKETAEYVYHNCWANTTIFTGGQTTLAERKMIKL